MSGFGGTLFLCLFVILNCHNCTLHRHQSLNKLFLRNERLTNVTDQNVREEFAKYKKSTVEKLYGYAEINGFQTGWTP